MTYVYVVWYVDLTERNYKKQMVCAFSTEEKAKEYVAQQNTLYKGRTEHGYIKMEVENDYQ